MAPDDVFVPYGPSHLVVLGIGVAGAVALVLIGRRLRDRPAARTFARGFALVIGAFEIAMQIRALTPQQWDIHTSLPLQLSDLAWMTSAYALWTGRRWACAAVYYWGLTLTPQAMFTPALDAPDFPHTDFVAFWGLHLLVSWAAIHLTWGMGIRPTWRGMRSTLAITLAWAAVTMTFNAVAGTNYGFLNHKPTNPSLLDLLGPWPWYVAVEFALVVAGWSLITLPWTRRRSTARQEDVR
ncbi:conserved hypothetical integral membrane protein TIGR02206 [Pseudonocardia ammonioxydans]|uniref:Conserved hypothetical integral membrane protein TIGR02206 n=1 Tax=Pseudonocardia ammonioxydans TaxID=260086 RepID=A0A1I5FJR3_PSUAM|nr:TIGR02206 family membrane protein [Pseudonocardia ammonioxydans]SFO23551.1 conserved hypothetical integral membrane protein TIGR02206 [Pseudonocardia ammonioxydans]